MKKVILIGATGFVGKALLQELVRRGHEVTAIARNADKVALTADNLRTVALDVTDTEALSAACRGADAVISAYNPGWSNPQMYEDTLRVYPAIIAAVKQAGVKRLQIVGGAGSLFVAPGTTVIDAGLIPAEIMPAVKGLAEILWNVLPKEQELDWVFFSPAGTFLTDGERTGTFRLGKDDLIVDAAGNSTISVEDYAVAMVDELENQRHHRERFTIGY